MRCISMLRRMYVLRNLPCVRKQHKLRVVMDIDECMVHSKIGEINKPRNLEPVESVTFTLLDNETVCRSFIRPHLQEYLKFVSSFADVFAFTAGMDIYAIPLLKQLDPENKIFKNAWYRCSCTQYDGYYVKDLRIMNELYHEERTVLVDNNPVSFIAQPSNGIHVKDFYGDASDNELESVAKLLHELHQDGGDVRPHLRRIFAMEERISSEEVNDYHTKVHGIYV